MKRKLLSLALALVMILSLLPAGAMAVEDVPEEPVPVEEPAPAEESAPVEEPAAAEAAPVESEQEPDKAPAATPTNTGSDTTGGTGANDALTALTTALSGTDATIALTGDITVTAPIKVERAVTIDFGTYTVSGNIGSGGYIFEVGQKASNNTDYETMAVPSKTPKSQIARTAMAAAWKSSPA